MHKQRPCIDQKINKISRLSRFSNPRSDEILVVLADASIADFKSLYFIVMVGFFSPTPTPGHFHYVKDLQNELQNNI